ncbi:hypothetical protein CVT24_006901 [Panaeolus cyanescens]|uniref:Aminoglycoside phosphotransferase domain-containing protein n=1 Tax=Panaeolus cyanescens TaxID=181874 RepID=A0A409YP04_9AGAR|nr:hypothetical protein CVT24_006901 [Panaeolus cyanescens]
MASTGNPLSSAQSIVIFGDSYSASSSTWVTYLKSSLNDTVTIHNFSVPGATVDDDLEDQLDRYLSLPSQPWRSSPKGVVYDIIEKIIHSADILYTRAGARNFIFVDVPPIDRSPRGININIEDDPSGDLESTLERAYTSYPKLRKQADERNKRLGEKEEKPSFPSPNSQTSQITPTSDNSTVASCVAESLLGALNNQEPLFVNGWQKIFTLGDDVLVKTGISAGSEEHEILSFVSEHFTSVVAPRPLGYMKIGQLSFLFMTRLPGQSLIQCWSRLDVSQKQLVRTLLDDMCRELRSLELSAGSPMGTVWDPRRCKDLRRYHRISSGPICSEAEFNEFLTFSDIPPRHVAAGYRKWVFSMLRTDHRIVFTHGDFHPRNIMIDIDSGGSLKLGLVDWEMAGFYPEYWELLKAFNTRTMCDESDWWDYLPPSILGYDHELLVDSFLERAFLPF